MKSKLFGIFLIFACIVISPASFAQYKYDIGLKASTYEMEQFQLEQRFHLDSPYSIVVTLTAGSRYSGAQSQTPLYNDTLFDISNSSFNATSNGIKVGLQRKLGFLATDVFYAGVTLGTSFEQQRSNYYNVTYSVENPDGTEPNIYGSQWTVINSLVSENSYRAINAQLALSFGMDVPITKRFSINAELAMAGMYSKQLNYSFSSIHLQPSISGGLRYGFGKKE